MADLFTASAEQVANFVGGLNFVPGPIAILVVGFVLGWFLNVFVRKFIKSTKLENLLKEIGITPTIMKVPIGVFAGSILMWAVFLIFIFGALESMGISILTKNAVEGGVSSVLKAILIFAIVIKAGEYVRSKMVYPKIPQSKLLGAIIYFCFIYMASLLSMTELFPQAAEVLTTLLIIFLGSLGLAIALGFGLSFGLGTKDIIGKFVAKRLKMK